MLLIEIDLKNNKVKELTDIDTQSNFLLECIDDKYLVYVEEGSYERRSKVYSSPISFITNNVLSSFQAYVCSQLEGKPSVILLSTRLLKSLGIKGEDACGGD